MKRLHRLILTMLPGPFLGWLGMLMFLLLMQFLIRYLPDIAGKGLPLSVIVELVAYNLAYMVVLAVPMSALLATLMAFGRLAETNAYMVIKSSGISLLQLAWPTILVGLALTACMWYFNSDVLPEANFRARNLWQDIRRKKPGFELQPGVFYDGLSHYSILVQHIPPGSNELTDVTIYDYTEGGRDQTVIKARRGRIAPLANGSSIDLVLENGEMHRLLPAQSQEEKERYERLAFTRHSIRLDLSDFDFERSDPEEGYRSDRTMPMADMIHYVDSLMMSVAQEKHTLRTLASMKDSTLYQDVRETLPTLGHEDADTTGPSLDHRVVLARLDRPQRREAYDLAMEHARITRSEIDNARRTIDWEEQRANRYRVEIYKKQSIALACLIFMLIGAPLGLSIRRGSLGPVAGVAVGIFLFYWVTLVQGEKLADRGFLEPWIGMWIANIITAVFGVWMVCYVAFDLRTTLPLRRRYKSKPVPTPSPTARASPLVTLEEREDTPGPSAS